MTSKPINRQEFIEKLTSSLMIMAIREITKILTEDREINCQIPYTQEQTVSFINDNNNVIYDFVQIMIEEYDDCDQILELMIPQAYWVRTYIDEYMTIPTD